MISMDFMGGMSMPIYNASKAKNLKADYREIRFLVTIGVA
jgi:hypothetical protein